jgi:hypothetical protein
MNKIELNNDSQYELKYNELIEKYNQFIENFNKMEKQNTELYNRKEFYKEKLYEILDDFPVCMDELKERYDISDSDDENISGDDVDNS